MQTDNVSNSEPVKFVERVERLHGELRTHHAQYMKTCRELRAGIKDVFAEAREAGLSRTALRAVIKARALEAKVDEVRTNLEEEDLTAYDAIRIALGDFASLPLGEAALAALRPFPQSSEGEMTDRPFGAPPDA